jgi:protein phosphatase PTC7
VVDKQTSQLHTANLGDSGFCVVRDGRVVHRSREQCHYFNAPYQMALFPQVARKGPDVGGFLSDSPEQAETSAFELLEGDCILMATDGLFDNVPTKLIELELEAVGVCDQCLHMHLVCAQVHSIVDGDRLQAVCNSITLAARRLSLDEHHDSPFAQKAREHGIHEARGGKPDDITVMLIVIVNDTTDNHM